VSFAKAALAALALASISSRLAAAPPAEAPPECRAQVQIALLALAPGYAKAKRKLVAASPGTIEHAIAAYAPARFHAVSEGMLGPIRPEAHCPVDMALVFDRFCIDRYEGSLVERLPDGTVAPVSPYVTPASVGHVYLARSVKGVIPQGYISAAEAAEACKASGKRLCEPVEWRVACGGSEGYAQPYGPWRHNDKCHDSGASPMLVYHQDSMQRGWGQDELNDPRNNQLEGTVAKTGAFPDCKNDFEVYDMVGNLHEWTADPNGTFQGGYWLDTSQHGDGCAYRTISHGYDYHDYSTGFRCCADPASTADSRHVY